MAIACLWIYEHSRNGTIGLLLQNYTRCVSVGVHPCSPRLDEFRVHAAATHSRREDAQTLNDYRNPFHWFSDSHWISGGAVIIGDPHHALQLHRLQRRGVSNCRCRSWRNGGLYGTAASGGTTNFGTVFSLTPPASSGGAWTETTLHTFSGKDGAYPYSPLFIGHGVLYGTTVAGGISENGILFR